jgi:dihydrolipoamide dehydrogenase
MIETFDLIVVGGGRAANLAIPAAKAGMKTALIERDRLGGACPNRGCVPSKLLIGFAEAARHVKHANRHFIDAAFNGADLEKIFASVNHYVGGVDARYLGRLQAAGVDVVRGEARFIAPKTIEAAGRQLTADKIVIATGSRPITPPFADLPMWTSDNLFPLRDKPPRSLIVIGGGFIGCEMAAFFAAVGTETHLMARGGRLLSREDSDIEQVFQAEFGKEVTTHCHAGLTHLEWDGSLFTATFDIHGQSRTFTAERVLFAIGRVPNTDMLDLHHTGLSTDERGFLPVNDHLETEVPGIYATGDVNGRFMLQHAAAFEVHYLRQRFLKGTSEPIDERHVAHAVFSYPEVASIGLTEDQLKAAGTPYVAVFEDWLASARAEAMRIDYPRIKLLVSPADYSILGCHLVGPESSTLLHQVMMLMRLKNDVRELANMIYIHPALNECLLAAAVKAVAAVKKHSTTR